MYYYQKGGPEDGAEGRGEAAEVGPGREAREAIIIIIIIIMIICRVTSSLPNFPESYILAGRRASTLLRLAREDT